MKLEKLKERIKPNEIQWRVQSKGNGKTTVVPYLTNRCVMERFDEQFGATNWQNVFCEWRSKGVKCGISVNVDGNWVTKYDGADETHIEPTKGGFSDSMKRAAVQWGLGRDLYDYPMIQIDGEFKYIPRWAESKLYEISETASCGGNLKHYYLISQSQQEPNYKASTPSNYKASPKQQVAPQPKEQPKAKPELKPETEQWEKAIEFLVGGGLISSIEGKYALDKVNKQLLMDTALDKA